MALKRVTMQDIADACSLSRNTVSKVFNDRGAVPETTRRMVLHKAQELGYLQVPDATPQSIASKPSTEAQDNSTTPKPRFQNVALITAHMPSEFHFAIIFLPAFTECLSRAGYTLMMYETTPEELQARKLPSHLSLENTAGILGMELFDRGYVEMLTALGLPLLMVDSFSGASLMPMTHDLILMENLASSVAMTTEMIAHGAKHLGFVGDPNHCCSFQERWQGFNIAMNRAGLSIDRRLSILDSDSQPYNEADWIQSQIKKMPTIPDAIFCANDFLAFRVVTALKSLSLTIPGDVMVSGFDNAPQSPLMEPSLTTVHIPNLQFGRVAADILLNRISHPDRPYSNTYVHTSPVWRNSTARKPENNPA